MSQSADKPVAIVMSAGMGKRMNSSLPKVLIEVLGRPMIDYVLDTLTLAGVHDIVVVVGYQADAVRTHVATRRESAAAGPRIRFAEQRQQLGTGHAVMMCRDLLADHAGPVVVVAGDSPMMRADSLQSLLKEFSRTRPACLLGTTTKDDPHGLGRIVRDAQGKFSGIVEEKDASPEQRAIREVNLSCYVFDGPRLFAALDAVRPDNAQGEYYLTDCPKVLLKQGYAVEALPVLKPSEALSINTPAELQAVEAALRDGCV